MGFKVIVDDMLCEGNAMCMDVAPEVFDLNDDDLAVVLHEELDEDQRDKVEHAVQYCPKQALSVVAVTAEEE